MAAIRPYEQQTTTFTRNVEPMAQPPWRNAGAELAAGGEKLAASMTHAELALQARDEEQGRAWASTTVSKSRLDWTQTLTDRMANAEPGAPNFTPNLIKDFDEYANKTLDTAPTKSAQRFLTNHLDSMRDQIGQKAIAFEAQARLDYRTDQFTQAIDDSKKLMNTDPTQFGPALADQLAIIDASSMPPVQKSAIRQKAIDGLSTAAVTAQIQKSPTAFLQSIGFLDSVDPSNGKIRRASGDLNGKTGNQAFDIMPFEKRNQLFQQAIQQKALMDADVERTAKQQQARLADDAMKDIYASGVDGKLTRNQIEMYRPILSHQEYQSALKILEKPEPGQKTDPTTFRNIEKMIAAGQYQEAEQAAFSAHQAGLLSNADLATKVMNARTFDRQEGPKSQYELEHKYIVDSLDPGPFVKDPLGKQRFAEAISTFDQWVKTGKHTDDEIRARSREIVGQYKFVNYDDTIMALPTPRSGHITRQSADPAKTLAELQIAGKEAQRRYDAGELRKSEYEQEMAIMNRWRVAAKKGNK